MITKPNKFPYALRCKADVQVKQTVMCMLLVSVEVLLLLDQIKPIEHLVPVN